MQISFPKHKLRTQPPYNHKIQPIHQKSSTCVNQSTETQHKYKKNKLKEAKHPPFWRENPNFSIMTRQDTRFPIMTRKTRAQLQESIKLLNTKSNPKPPHPRKFPETKETMRWTKNLETAIHNNWKLNWALALQWLLQNLSLFFPLFLGESPIGGSGGARVCGLENRSEPETCGFDFKAIRVVPEKTEPGRKVETREMGKWCVWRRLMKYTNSSRWGWIHYPTRVDIGSGCVRFGLRVGGVVGWPLWEVGADFGLGFVFGKWGPHILHSDQ